MWRAVAAGLLHFRQRLVAAEAVEHRRPERRVGRGHQLQLRVAPFDAHPLAVLAQQLAGLLLPLLLAELPRLQACRSARCA
jgi:hypothetical protein